MTTIDEARWLADARASACATAEEKIGWARDHMTWADNDVRLALDRALLGVREERQRQKEASQ